MKKNKIVGILALAMFGLAGCDGIIPKECTHEYGSWEDVEYATCVRKGTRVATCTLCGKEKTKTAPVDLENGHKWVSDNSSNVDATCLREGFQGGQKCKYCDETKGGQATPKIDHVYTPCAVQPTDEKYKEATCQAEGLEQHECYMCGKKIDVTLPKTDHNAEFTQIPGSFVNRVTCKDCGTFVGYELRVLDADGWNNGESAMQETATPGNMSTWNIGGIIPEGSYDVLLEAKVEVDNGGEFPSRKYYNMSIEGLATASDIAYNNGIENKKDDPAKSKYRYFVDVDGNEFNPKTSKSFKEIGFDTAVNGSFFKFGEFVQGVRIGSGTQKISLCHGDLGVALLCKSIRLIPHEHDGTPLTEYGTTGQTPYTIEKCSCGYRKITIDAAQGVIASGKWKTGIPTGYSKLDGNSSVKYKFNILDNIQGEIYMVGRQDNYPTNKTQSPYNCEWSLNGEQIEFTKAGAVSQEFFGDSADSTFGTSGYSKEAKVIIGEIAIPSSREACITYERTGSYNLAISKIVIEGTAVDHICDYERNPAKDQVASCTTPGQEAYSCSCGKTIYKPSQGAIGHSFSKAVVVTAPTCTKEGLIKFQCDRCGSYSSNYITIPPMHSYENVDVPSAADYSLQRCVKCGSEYVEWAQLNNLIKDKSGTDYVAADVTAITGKTSDASANMTVYNMNKANRRVELKYNNDGDAKQVTLKVLVSAKASEINSCKLFANADSSARFNVTLNNNAVSVAAANKTLADLGASGVSTAIDGTTALSDAIWVDFCTLNLASGENTIVFEATSAQAQNIYFGGFALSYEA